MHSTRIRVDRSRSPRPVSANHDAWYERRSEGSVLQEQFFDCRVKLAAVCPETALMYAVLEDAFICFHEKSEGEPRFMRRTREAEKWFFSDDSRGLFSFESVCDALGLEPRYIRTKLKHWSPKGGAARPAAPRGD